MVAHPATDSTFGAIVGKGNRDIQVPGSPLLHNTHILLQLGHEVCLKGVFTDYDDDVNVWHGKVCGNPRFFGGTSLTVTPPLQVSAVTFMSSHNNSLKNSAAEGMTVTKGGRAKPPK